MAYVTQADLESRIGTATARICWDDGGTGFPLAVALSGGITQACAKVDAKLARLRVSPLPVIQVPVPAMIKEAALLFLVAYTYQRRPEYARRYGGGPMEVAEKFLEDLADAKDYLVDLLSQKKPTVVGGVVNDPDAARLCVTDLVGNVNSGDF